MADRFLTHRAQPPERARTQPPEHDFTQDREAWERSVFMSAVKFTSCLHLGRGDRETNIYLTLDAAIADASTRRDPWGRRPIVYAVAASGRFVVLDEAHWPVWTILDKERIREKAKSAGRILAAVSKKVGKI